MEPACYRYKGDNMLLNELLNIKYPIIQGAMANIATGEFAAAVSNAGGLGIIASGGWDDIQTEKEIIKCKELTDKPFGVNVMLMNPFADKIIDVIIAQNVPVVTTGAGNPGVYIEKLKKAGIKIFPVVANVALAKRMARLKVDGIIVEGCEAGGHVGEATTMTLLPQMCDAIDLPIIAAGGIADARGFVAALALGACGIQVGTCLLVSEECPIHDNYKQAVIKAKDNDTVVTGRSLNTPVRILKNHMSRQYLALEKTCASAEELEKLTLGALRRAVFDGDIQNGSVMMGQIAGLCDQIKPLKVIFKDICTSSTKTVEQLNEAVKSL